MTGKLKIVAAGFLLVGALLIITAMLSRPSAPPSLPAPVAVKEETGFAVVVAKSTLPFGEPVQGESLAIERVPEKPEGSYSNVADVIGRIPVLTVQQGQKVTRTAFETNPMADQVRTGFRAVAIRVDEQMAGIGRLKPGDIVDVFTVFRRDDRDINATQSRQVLSRLRVITVGPRIVGQPENTDPAATQQQQAGNTRNVTVEVPVADVNLLLLAQQQGSLMLALRNPEDSGAAQREAFPEPVALLKKKEPKDRKAPPEPLSADDRAYAGVSMDSVVAGSPPRSVSAPAGPVARTDTARNVKETREEAPRIEMIRRGKVTSEAAQ